MHETIPEARVEGEVKIGELEVYAAGPIRYEIRRRIGMVFQKPNPFPTMSIYDNVAAGLKLNGFAIASSWTKWSSDRLKLVRACGKK